MFRTGNSGNREGWGNHYLFLKILPSAIVIIVFALLVMDGRREDAAQSAELSAIAEEQRTRKEQDKAAEEAAALAEWEAALTEKESSYSFYQKLAEGLDVNILIVGDSIGAGTGADEGGAGWYSLLESYLKETYYTDSEYEGDVTITNISIGGNSSYAGYVLTMVLDYQDYMVDGVLNAESVIAEQNEEAVEEAVGEAPADYDLAILCYGQNDSVTDFEMYYESIIRAISMKYPDCSMIAILESSQLSELISDEMTAEEYQAITAADYPEKMQVIMEICDYYGIPTADMLAAFVSSGYEYDELTGDGTHPNNAGQTIYYETVAAVIDEEAAAGTGKPSWSEAYDSRAAAFDNFAWFEAEDTEGDENEEDDTNENLMKFTRVDEVTYALSVADLEAAGFAGLTDSILTGIDGEETVGDGNDTAATEGLSGILGIDYTYLSGDNTADIYIDGELYVSLAVTFDYDFSQRHILVVSDDVRAEEEIRVVFGSEEQADGFCGMCMSWGEVSPGLS